MENGMKTIGRVVLVLAGLCTIFGGLGLIFDDYHFLRTTFENAGVFSRTAMFVNQASWSDRGIWLAVA